MVFSEVQIVCMSYSEHDIIRQLSTLEFVMVSLSSHKESRNKSATFRRNRLLPFLAVSGESCFMTSVEQVQWNLALWSPQ